MSEKQTTYMPSEEEFKSRLTRRNRRAGMGLIFYYGSIVVALLALVTLFLTVIERSFGSVALVYEKDPVELSATYGTDIDAMDSQQLALLIEEEASGGLRKFIRDSLSQVPSNQFTREPLRVMLAGHNYPEGTGDSTINDLDVDDWVAIVTMNLSQAELRDYVQTDVIGIEIVAAWTLTEALFRYEVTDTHRAELARLDAEIAELDTQIAADSSNALLLAKRRLEQERSRLVHSVIELDAEVNHPEATLQRYHSWLNLDFVSSRVSDNSTTAGIRGALIGSALLMIIVLATSLPIGIGTAIYLEEYAADTWFNRIIETNVRNLAGVPSIVYGMLGLAVFVFGLVELTSGRAFGASGSDSGRTVISAGLTLALLVLPIIIISAQEALRAVPYSLREASYGLGATQWQTIWRTVLPAAIPSILTGTIIAISRAVGETAPLVVIGASSYLVVDPNGPFSQFSAMPLLVYQWSQQPEAQLFREIAAATIIVLLVLMLSLNAIAIILRNRYSVRY